MGSGCLVLVDGWNHYIAALRCFGYRSAAEFPLDRLALHVAAETGADAVSSAAVVMALPDRNRPEEAPEFHAWRKRLRKLRNYGVHHEPARFSYHQPACTRCRTSLDRNVTCGNCGASNTPAGRRKEKGADIRLASLALRGAWQQEYSTLIVLSQDSDFGPMVQEVKEVHRSQGRRYALYSAFPTCARPDHEHRAVPGTRELRLDSGVYGALIDRPRIHVTDWRAQAP
ncbi:MULTISPECIES: NYN domain-containing protein [unclassified Streptomyces]|uniref:NYN domain-containing protein n=1 Tax=unclassified Streptomyces TaxID=2593676 RepID=UPI002E2081A4